MRLTWVLQLHGIGIPACPTCTPWWGRADGTHARTWIRGLCDAPGDGKKGVKLLVKTWNGLEDATRDYTAVTTITVLTESTADAQALLMVWNSDGWRKITTADSRDGTVEFTDVGCGRNLALLIRITGEPDRIADVHTDGSVSRLRLAPLDSAESLLKMVLPEENPPGQLSTASKYELECYTTDGWQPLKSSLHYCGRTHVPRRSGSLMQVQRRGDCDPTDHGGDRLGVRRDAGAAALTQLSHQARMKLNM